MNYIGLLHRDRENWYKMFDDRDYDKVQAVQIKQIIAAFEEQHGMELSQDAEENLVTFLEMVATDQPHVWPALADAYEKQVFVDESGHRWPGEG